MEIEKDYVARIKDCIRIKRLTTKNKKGKVINTQHIFQIKDGNSWGSIDIIDEETFI